jgi:hypothetical protein
VRAGDYFSTFASENRILPKFASENRMSSEYRPGFAFEKRILKVVSKEKHKTGECSTPYITFFDLSPAFAA